MIVTVRDKEFNIGLVSNYVHKLYSELVDNSFKLSGCSKNAQDKAFARAEKLEAKPKLKEMKAMNVEFNKDIEKLNTDIKALTAEVTGGRLAIIKELLETNDYEYDSEWWDRRTCPEDLNDFMLKCLGKDQKETEEKKNTKKK